MPYPGTFLEMDSHMIKKNIQQHMVHIGLPAKSIKSGEVTLCPKAVWCPSRDAVSV